MDLKDVHERSGYSKRIVRVILDSADNLGIITTDENKIITFFSGGAEKNTWLQPRRTGRQRNSNEIPHRGRNPQPWQRSFRKGTGKNIKGLDLFAEIMIEGPERHDWTYKKKDGSLISVELTVTPIRDDKGNIRGAFGVFYDITDKKRLEEEFKSYKIQSSGIIANIPEPTFAIDLGGQGDRMEPGSRRTDRHSCTGHTWKRRSRIRNTILRKASPDAHR